MDQLAAILVSVVGVSLISFVGVFFAGLKENLLRRLVMALVGFASGTLLGGAFFHLLPEAVLEISPAVTIFYLVIFGMLVFFSVEKFLHWRHCHEEECEVHTFAYTNLVGDGIHNFVDGMIIAAAFIAGSDFSLGLATTLAVIFHEIPQEIGDFAVCVYGGLGRRKALFYNFVSALTAVLGAVVTYFVVFLRSNYILLIPFAAGGFIYIAATDLMPELHKRSRGAESVVQMVSLLLGLGLMAFMSSVLAG